jgi:hypothetical protein
MEFQSENSICCRQDWETQRQAIIDDAEVSAIKFGLTVEGNISLAPHLRPVQFLGTGHSRA